MKRAAKTVRRPRRHRLPEVDEGQILEMLRLTPEQRLFKAWRYAEFALELQAAGRSKDKLQLIKMDPTLRLRRKHKPAE